MARTVNLEKRAARRAGILDAAALCFVEKGFHSTSMQDICKAAAISPGALYRYFASKEDIIIAIVEDERHAAAALAADLAASDSLVEALATISDRIVVAAQEAGYAELSAEVFAEAMRNPKARAVALDGYASSRKALTAAIRAAINRGEISAEWHPQALASVLMSLFDGLETRGALGDSASTRAVRETIRRLLDALRAS